MVGLHISGPHEELVGLDWMVGLHIAGPHEELVGLDWMVGLHIAGPHEELVVRTRLDGRTDIAGPLRKVGLEDGRTAYCWST